MEKTIQDNILAHCMELALMPALLYSYRDGGVLYWIVLILMGCQLIYEGIFS